MEQGRLWLPDDHNPQSLTPFNDPVHLGQSGSPKPVWVSSAINGQAAVQFDATACVKSAAVDELAGSSEVTVFVVAVPDATQPAYASLVDLSSESARGFVLGQLGSATNQFQFWFMDAAQTGWYSSPAAPATAGAPQVISVVKNGTGASSFVNGAAVGTSNVPSAMLNPVAPLAIGNRASGLDGYSGKIAEVLVYNRALSDAERQQVEAALEASYSNPDADGNGLPDAWEIQYFGHTGVDPGALTPIGDGLTNLEAYLLGRNPTKPALPDTTGTSINLRVYSPGT